MSKHFWIVGLAAGLAAFLFNGLMIEHAQAAPAPEVRFGLNLAVAEFAGNEVPGIYGKHYTYPEASELDYYRAQGRTLIRFPFLWERMQRTPNGPLDADELARLRKFLQGAREKKMDVILDAHNYGRYLFAGEAPEKRELLGSDRLPVSVLGDLWGKLAAAVKDEPALYGYGLMNEPHDMGDETRWPRAAQAAINAIRQVDKKTTIYLAGDGWSSARGWRQGPNETLNEKVRDPQNNLVFEAHCYFDKDMSGAYKNSYDADGTTPDTGIEHVRPFVEWCREKGVRGFVGEYGVPDNDTRWLVVMDRFLAYLKANKISSAYWAAGPWWGDYFLSIEPGKSTATPSTPVDRPQMLILRQYPG